MYNCLLPELHLTGALCKIFTGVHSAPLEQEYIWKTLISMQQRNSTTPEQEHCCHERSLQHRQPQFVPSVLRSQVVLPSRQPHILLHPLHSLQKIRQTGFILPDVSPIPILRNKRSGRGRRRSSANAAVPNLFDSRSPF